MGACEYLDHQPAVLGRLSIHYLNNYQKDQEMRRVYGFFYLFTYFFTDGAQHLLWGNKHFIGDHRTNVGLIHILLFSEKR